MKVHLYTVAWNEAPMLPFFFRHYDPWVDRYVIFDDGSDDGSLTFYRANPKVEVRPFQRRYSDTFALSHTHLLNEAWKESRGQADWVVMPDIDELLHVPGTSMADYLEECSRAGVTYLPALGFNALQDEFPDSDADLIELTMRVTPHKMFNKALAFRPDKVWATGYLAGRHTALPVGSIVLPREQRLLLFHYKLMGLERTRQRQLALGARVLSGDKANRVAIHYGGTDDEFRRGWEATRAGQIDVKLLAKTPEKYAEGPFWWRRNLALRYLRFFVREVDIRLGGHLYRLLGKLRHR